MFFLIFLTKNKRSFCIDNSIKRINRYLGSWGLEKAEINNDVGIKSFPFFEDIMSEIWHSLDLILTNFKMTMAIFSKQMDCFG